MRPITTGVGASTADAIYVRGRDVARELMGNVGLGEMAFLLVAGREPSAPEALMFNAALISLADHGLTPTVLAARLTYTGAPESIQGAVAAGILGAGSVYLGVTEDTARYLGEIIARAGSDEESALADAAKAAVQDTADSGARVPGLGHGIHKSGDPRTARLYELAVRAGGDWPHMRTLKHLQAAAEERYGRSFPINGAGTAGAVFADLGFPPRVARGLVLIARSAGLVAQVYEESETPLGHGLYADVESNIVYRPRPEPR
jgi:citrate synthase